VVSDEQRRAVLRYDNPFVAPPEEREPVRRLRGRLVAPVTVWTAGTAEDPAGLTVSSLLVAEGDPSRLLGLVDALSDLWERIEGHQRFLVNVLGEGDQGLADRFSGARPGPGGPFGGLDTTPSAFGPILPGVDTWAGCRLVEAAEVGYHLLVQGTLEELALGDARPLAYHRGRFRRLTGDR
jgi:flavin reductase (DIM6/NTAB) family NADH-FMN oxidoreductase RutF